MKTVFVLFMAGCFGLLVSQPSLAQGTSVAETIVTARRVAEYGYANKNPLCLLAAAQIMANTNPNKLVAKMDKGESAVNAGKKEEINLDVDKLIKDAQAMASPTLSNEVTALANKIQPVRSRGALGGPKMTQGQSVEAKATDTFTIEFKGAEKAELTLVGDLDGDLDLLVYDEAGKLVASDTAGTDKCVVAWTPAQKGNFVVHIKNLNGETNRYTLITN
jgi:hypothetical protein